jgi:hypothetical protein
MTRRLARLADIAYRRRGRMVVRVGRGTGRLPEAIFLDATVVRTVLVPAVTQLLGSRSWWIPDWLERILPRLDVERVTVGAEARP